jgi:ATP-dependent DNA helicase RecG
MMTDAELEELLVDLESDRVERKRTASDRSRIRRTICAFANDLPAHGLPGVVFVGVNDDGSCANLTATDELLTQLSNMRSDGGILPQPTMLVQKRTLRGCEVVAVIVHPAANPPVRYEGRVWVRVGPAVSQATPEDERRLAEKRRSRDMPFDSQAVPDATLDDIDVDFFRRVYLPSAVAEDVLEQNRRNTQHQLASLRLVAPDGTPTYGCVLALGRDPMRFVPGAYVQFVRFDGPDLTSPIRARKAPLSGPICDVLRTLDDLLEVHISTAVDVVSGPTEIATPDYPVAALRQLVRNAVMHRAYDVTNAPVRINWFSDRIEITNPGGLFGQVNPRNFGQGVTDYRNPVLAEAMRVLGFVQRFGIGIPLARAELEKNGNPAPEFQFDLGTVLVTVRAKS